MAFADLREWIAKLESEGDLRRIKAEVNWDREIGAILRSVYNKQQGPALLFENIKDYNKGGRCTKLFVNSLGAMRRTAWALGLPTGTSHRDMVKIIKERLLKPVKPVVVEKGAVVKSNVIEGEEVDLNEFPVPKWHHRDGGRYINTTTGGVITKDPETGVLNSGTYRGMITSKNTIASFVADIQDYGKHFSKYRDRGEPMPVAVVYGWDPALTFCSAAPLPHDQGYSEYDYAGALRGAPVELVKCETNDLLVPASAEIVVEGYISTDPKDVQMEGPFGEFTGYYGGRISPKPYIQVTCITHRNDPILRGSLDGSSPGTWSETPYYVTPTVCAVVWNAIERSQVHNVLDVWGSPVTTSGPTNMMVRIRKSSLGHAQRVAHAIWASHPANVAAKHLMVVDEDIDVHDYEALDWAFAWHVNAGMGDIQFFCEGAVGSSLDPSVSLRDKPDGYGKWTRVLIDATRSWELPKEEQFGGNRFPPLCTTIAPEEKALVDRRWKDYGID